jgi:DUF1680 family protein
MEPRVSIPDPRIDAVRGSIALECGPLVYAVEDADLPAGKSVESVEVSETPHLEAVTSSEPGLGELKWLTLDADIRDDSAANTWPYPSTPKTAKQTTRTKIRALPYFAWGNRAGLGMRIWLPTRAPRGDR